MTGKHIDDKLYQRLAAYEYKTGERGWPRRDTKALWAYSVVAAGMTLVAPESVFGTVVHRTTAVALAVPNAGVSSAFFDIDLDAAGGNDWNIALAASTASTIAKASHKYPGGLGATVATNTTATASAIKLSAGFVVGSSLATGVFNSKQARLFLGGNTIQAGPFANGTTGYLGLQFQGDTGTAGTQYAWVKVRFDFDAQAFSLTMNILEWAYDNSGAPIEVGDTGAPPGGVPAPDTGWLALLGLGAVGVQAFRRRKQERLEAAASA